MSTEAVTLEINSFRMHVLKRGMMQSGLPNHAATAVALALEYAAANPLFAAQFGAFTQEHLHEALENMRTEQVRTL